MQRTINFGKIDYNHSGRCNCPVEVTLELREYEPGKPVFSAIGYIWNSKHTKIHCAGQCQDTIAEYVNTDLFREVYRLWNTYHLNDMKDGTAKQEKAVKEYLAQGNDYDYRSVCKYLKSIDLLEDDYDGYKYTYGTDWCYDEIPEQDFQIIYNLINEKTE